LSKAFRIEDANGQAVAYTYFRRDENTARQGNVLTYDEARRIAANIAKLPELSAPTRGRALLATVDMPTAGRGTGERVPRFWCRGTAHLSLRRTRLSQGHSSSIH
jgi:hypothetical protein